FRHTQQAAFSAERARWVEQGEFSAAEPAAGDLDPGAADEVTVDVPPGGVVVAAPLSASVWSVGVKEGDRIAAGDTVAVLEAMKMETAVVAPAPERCTRSCAGPARWWRRGSRWPCWCPMRDGGARPTGVRT